ncbi:MAG TPA: hypothetical protein VFG39_03380 [Balneolaceae bacterium]|nr:hypothetical protein [Balneolaceae bacterium]
MKTILFALTFSALLVACSSSKDTANAEMMQVVDATFGHWQEKLDSTSDIAERGTDLKVTLKNWPEGYTPAYIIFRGKKSSAAEVAERVNGKTIIRARIIHQSAVLRDKSESVNLSDRLVFKKENGDTGFIEINDWKRVEG